MTDSQRRYHFVRQLGDDETVSTTDTPFVAVVYGLRFLVDECHGDDCYECRHIPVQMFANATEGAEQP